MDFGQLHHIEYYVKDLARSNLFWNWFMPFMGYEEYQRWDCGVSWRHRSGTYVVFVQLAPDSTKISNDRQGCGLNHIAFMGKDLIHFESLRTELNKNQIKILKAKEKYICFEDPNDFAVEVYLP